MVSVGTYKITVNRAAMYPLPKVDDLLATLWGGKIQVRPGPRLLTDPTRGKKYLAINMHKGLYAFLPFGVTSAPSIFQRTMEGIIRGIPNICVYIDDILIAGGSKAESWMKFLLG